MSRFFWAAVIEYIENASFKSIWRPEQKLAKVQLCVEGGCSNFKECYFSYVINAYFFEKKALFHCRNAAFKNSGGIFKKYLSQHSVQFPNEKYQIRNAA